MTIKKEKKIYTKIQDRWLQFCDKYSGSFKKSSYFEFCSRDDSMRTVVTKIVL
jgi:hypothetical protein